MYHLLIHSFRHREERKHGIMNDYEQAIKDAKQNSKGKWFEATATTSADFDKSLRDGYRSDDEVRLFSLFF